MEEFEGLRIKKYIYRNCRRKLYFDKQYLFSTIKKLLLTKPYVRGLIAVLLL